MNVGMQSPWDTRVIGYRHYLRRWILCKPCAESLDLAGHSDWDELTIAGPGEDLSLCIECHRCEDLWPGGDNADA